MRYLALLLTVLLLCAADHTRLINGTPVQPGTYKEVVQIVTGQSGCTAALIGPRAMVTAAHCAQNGATSVFKVDGKEYRAKITRSPVYPGRDHDVALGLVDKEVEGVKPVSVYKGEIRVGDKLHLLGYGCQKPGGGGPSGALHEGDATVSGKSGYDIVSKGGAALCFGDSGGPGMIFDARRATYAQATVNSKGNIQDTNYTTDLTNAESQDFMKRWAQTNAVDICGVTKDCDGPAPGKHFVRENSAFKAEVWDKGVHQDGYVERVMDYVAAYLETGSSEFQQLPDKTGPIPVPEYCTCPSGDRMACGVTRPEIMWCGPGDSCWCQ